MAETTGISDQLWRIRRDMLVLMLVWSAVIGLSLAFGLYQHLTAFHAEVYAQAKGIYTMDRSYREWAIGHGGVYVEATKKTPPSPYLKEVPERDVTTPSDRTLTLLNSSYMTREVHELMDAKNAPVRGHIASLKPINPVNRADAWEQQALRAFEQGKEEVSGMDRMADGKTYFRYMQPMVTEQACLKCHVQQGYKVGDIRGGISVSIPVDQPLEAENRETLALVSGHGLIWVLGLGGIYASGRRQRHSLLRIEQASEQNEQHLLQIRESLGQAVAAVAKAVEARDPYTAGHQRRVAELAAAIAKQMGLDDDRIEGIRMGATIHDIGKIQVPAEILTKPGKLTDIEYRIVREHPKVGYAILQDIRFPWPVAEIAYQHHERLDGSGYPQGLKGEEIGLEACIVAVADVVEAMSSHRPYRAGLGLEVALDEVTNNKGVLYDAAAVEACVQVFADGFKFDE
ncbi:MAG TPA: HD domain-containing phosphohydrolase [Mariprofundaceae bacterium]|nr:HD domain-containing phosphohydrolase [Mariprofundaceae bacterium]